MQFFIVKPNHWQKTLFCLTVCLNTLDLPLVAFYKPTVQSCHTKLVWSQSSSCLLPSYGWGFVYRISFMFLAKLALCLVWSVSFTGVCTRLYLLLCICVQPLSQFVVVETIYLYVYIFFTFVALLQDSSKSPRPMKKFLPGNRKKERKPSDDDIQTRKSEDSLLLYRDLQFAVQVFHVCYFS